jgi:hypothetical protein
MLSSDYAETGEEFQTVRSDEENKEGNDLQSSGVNIGLTKKATDVTATEPESPSILNEAPGAKKRNPIYSLKSKSAMARDRFAMKA